jgi:hypothetical protein
MHVRQRQEIQEVLRRMNNGFMLRLSFRPINASKELATSAVEVIAYRPEKNGDAVLGTAPV